MMARYAGWGLTALSTLFLLMDGGMKLIGATVSVEATTALGFTAEQVPLLGAVLVASAILYVVPATSILGAILVTGYLGGAVAINMRQGTPLASHMLFGVYLGVLVWAGVYLKTPALRRILPLLDEADDTPPTLRR
jgi:hypothetical protein